MTGLVILAAGGSSRLGTPKQNLIFNGKTLLQHAVDTALASGCLEVLVVLGGNADQIIIPAWVRVITNPDWQQGMSSSIKLAIEYFNAEKAVESVIIMLCDQPFVTAGLLNELVTTQQSIGKSIVCCAYNNIIGVPALFERSVFPELLSLKGEEGAKQILKNHRADLAAIPFDPAQIDIDTPADYNKLIQGEPL